MFRPRERERGHPFGYSGRRWVPRALRRVRFGPGALVLVVLFVVAGIWVLGLPGSGDRRVEESFALQGDLESLRQVIEQQQRELNVLQEETAGVLLSWQAAQQPLKAILDEREHPSPSPAPDSRWGRLNELQEEVVKLQKSVESFQRAVHSQIDQVEVLGADNAAEIQQMLALISSLNRKLQEIPTGASRDLLLQEGGKTANRQVIPGSLEVPLYATPLEDALPSVSFVLVDTGAILSQYQRGRSKVVSCGLDFAAGLDSVERVYTTLDALDLEGVRRSQILLSTTHERKHFFDDLDGIHFVLSGTTKALVVTLY